VVDEDVGRAVVDGAGVDEKHECSIQRKQPPVKGVA
jgi:hypothetical protein